MTTENRSSWKITAFKIGCVVVSVVIGFVTLEVAARALGLGDPVLYYAAAWGGLRPVPNQHHVRLGGAKVTIDENGYRTPVPDKKGAKRVLFIGDSITWGGTSIDDRDVFTEVAADVLREKGIDVYAMNAGVISTGLLNHAEIFQQYLNENGNPDAVVWLFPWSDVHRAFTSGGIMFPAHYKPDFALVEVIDYLLIKYWAVSFRDVKAFNEDFVTPNLGSGESMSFEMKCAVERRERNMAAMRAVVAQAKERGIPIFIGLCPYRDGDGFQPFPPDAAPFLKAIEEEGATLIDVPAVLQGDADTAAGVFLDNVHFSKEGHKRMGKALGEALEKAIGQEPGA